MIKKERYMIKREHYVIAYNLVHRLIFNYKWTQEDEDKLQELARMIETEDPKDYPGNRVQFFIDVFGSVEFIKKYYPKRL